MKIDIKISKVLSRLISVDGLSLDDALRIVEDMYKAQEIILDSDDFDSNLMIEKIKSLKNRQIT